MFFILFQLFSLCSDMLSKRTFLAPIIIRTLLLAVFNLLVFAFLLWNKTAFFFRNICTNLSWYLLTTLYWNLFWNRIAFVSWNIAANVSWLGEALLGRYLGANCFRYLCNHILAYLVRNFFAFCTGNIMTGFSRNFSTTLFGYLNWNCSAYIFHLSATFLPVNFSRDLLRNTSWDISTFFSWNNSALALGYLAWNMSCNRLALILGDGLAYLAWNLFCNFDTSCLWSVMANLSWYGLCYLSWNFSAFSLPFLSTSWYSNFMTNRFLYFSAFRCTYRWSLGYSI